MAKLITITGKAVSGEWGTDDETGNGIPVLRTTNFTNTGNVNYSNVVTRTIKKKNLEDKYLRSGDIIIEKSGGSDTQPVGRVIFFEGPSNKYLFNNFTGLLRVKDQTNWHSKYVFYSLFYNYITGGTKQFENRTTGLHNLKTELYVNNFDVPDRPLPEQERIVAVLDSADRMIRLRRRELSLLDDLVKSRFVEMFGSVHDNQFNYPVKMIAEIASEIFAGGDKPEDCSSTQDEEHPYPVYANGYENNGLQGYSKSCRVTKDAVTISARGTIGYCFIRKANFTPVVRLITVVPSKDIIIDYLKEAIELLNLKSTGTSQAQLIVPDFKKELLIVPPIELQEQFSDFIAQVDKAKAAIKKGIDEAQLLFDALMQQYFG